MVNSSMEYNERLMNEAIQGDDDSLKELKFNASSGDSRAQYYLAMYYAKICGHLHDPDYWYWKEKYEESTKRDGRLIEIYGGCSSPAMEFADILKCLQKSHSLSSILSFLL